MSPSGGSILTTFAPRSVSIRPQWGPDRTREKSSTRIPSRGPGPRVRGAVVTERRGYVARPSSRAPEFDLLVAVNLGRRKSALNCPREGDAYRPVGRLDP